MGDGIALVRPPAATLADGIVTHIERQSVDVDLARQQHATYVAALESAGWNTIEVPVIDDLPDSVFVEDTVVVVDDLAILTRPGAAVRRPEVDGVESVLRTCGVSVRRIEEPDTLDGGDVLQVGRTIYIGRGGRTTPGAIAQFAKLVEPYGRTVVGVDLGDVLHLKSAVTALPDGVFVGDPALVDMSQFEPWLAVPEPSGCHVVLLGGDHVLMASSAPRTADLFERRGLTPYVVDISEFEKLEGCVTCLSVLIG